MKHARILLALIPLAFTSCSKSTGTRVGVITKFSQSGWINKTWEGDLSLNQFTSQANAQGVWSFSVDDGPLVAEIQKAMDTGKRVRITYDKKAIQMPWSAETYYRVTGAAVIPE